MKRSLTCFAIILTVALPSLVLAPASLSAEKLPKVGERCGIEDHWRGIPVRKVVSKKTKQVSLVARKKGSGDKIVCVPMDVHDLTGANPYSAAWEFQPDWRIRSRFPDLTATDFARDPSNDPCRLRPSRAAREGGPVMSLGWDPASYSPEALLPTDRPVKGLVIHTWQPSADPDAIRPNVDLATQTMRDALVVANEYWEQQSLGRFGIDLDFVGKLQEEVPGGFGDVLDNVDAEVDFSNYDFILKTGPFESGGMVNFPVEYVRDGKFFDFVINVGNLAPIQNQYEFLLMHEIGHAIGLPDLYAYPGENELSDRFVNSVLMSRGSRYLTGYERWILGWLPDSRVACVTKDGQGSLILSNIEASGSGPGMAIFPTAPDRAVVIENRSQQLPIQLAFEDQLLFEYWVNASSGTSLDAGFGEPDVCEQLSDPRFCTYEREPAMVTYRRDQGTLLRARIPKPSWDDYEDVNAYEEAIWRWRDEVLGVPAAPIRSDFDSENAWREAYSRWQIKRNEQRYAMDLDPYLRYGQFFQIEDPWLGLQVTASPERRGERTNNPRWYLPYKFVP